MVDSPSGGASAKAPRWDLADIEVYGGGIRFLAPYLIVWGYVGIYRRKEYVGGATWGPRGWRARPPLQGTSPISWAPRAATDLRLPPIYTHVPRKHPGSQRKTISTAITFYIREIPSWSLRRHFAGGGIDHGGLLHQHPFPSYEL